MLRPFSATFKEAFDKEKHNMANFVIDVHLQIAG
jgi:hypothetical protein